MAERLVALLIMAANVAALSCRPRRRFLKLLLLRSLNGAPPANGRMALTVTLQSKVFTA